VGLAEQMTKPTDISVGFFYSLLILCKGGEKNEYKYRTTKQHS
jgi:hypothetical protein